MRPAVGEVRGLFGEVREHVVKFEDGRLRPARLFVRDAAGQYIPVLGHGPCLKSPARVCSHVNDDEAHTQS